MALRPPAQSFAPPSPLVSVLWFWGSCGCLRLHSSALMLLSSAIRPGPGHGSGRLGRRRVFFWGGSNRYRPVGAVDPAACPSEMYQTLNLSDRKAIRVVTKLSHGPYKIIASAARGPSKPAFPSLSFHGEKICPAAPEPKEKSWPGAPRASREEAKPHRNRMGRGEAGQCLLSPHASPPRSDGRAFWRPGAADLFRFEPRVCV